MEPFVLVSLSLEKVEGYELEMVREREKVYSYASSEVLVIRNGISNETWNGNLTLQLRTVTWNSTGC